MNKGYKSRRMKIQPEIEEGNMKCHQVRGIQTQTAPKLLN